MSFFTISEGPAHLCAITSAAAPPAAFFCSLEIIVDWNEATSRLRSQYFRGVQPESLEGDAKGDRTSAKKV
jgi:hypothetical protein